LIAFDNPIISLINETKKREDEMPKEKKLKLNYFVWGTIDGETKSFYL